MISAPVMSVNTTQIPQHSPNRPLYPPIFASRTRHPVTRTRIVLAIRPLPLEITRLLERITLLHTRYLPRLKSPPPRPSLPPALYDPGALGDLVAEETYHRRKIRLPLRVPLNPLKGLLLPRNRTHEFPPVPIP